MCKLFSVGGHIFNFDTVFISVFILISKLSMWPPTQNINSTLFFIDRNVN